ncbi:MAG: hypothetical protein H7301_03935 [Cryobacterium sp.]|nr:hypothetical protein [Oligoflexia bacterium]
MKKGTKKAPTSERRKHPRRAKKPEAKGGAREASDASLAVEHCTACEKTLKGDDRALFVEEEVGRIFCSEDCITQHFQPQIDLIEKQYFKFRPKDDLTPEEREQFAHLRWITIQEPDEIWLEKQANGDKRHTLISQFKPGSKPVWCVCICLYLRGEPSFLYMAFPTRSKALVERFRRGDRVEYEKSDPAAQTSDVLDAKTDGLAAGWSQAETIRAEIHGTRDARDIPEEEYGLYENLLEKTLSEPDELWIVESKDDGEPDRYQFLKSFPDEEGGPIHYVVVAQESDQTEHLEVLEQIPTRNFALLRHYRRGRQELTPGDDEPSNKTVH